MATAEHIERQIAVAIVIAVEVPPLLLAVQRIIRRIQVENDLSGARACASRNRLTRGFLIATGLWLILW